MYIVISNHKIQIMSNSVKLVCNCNFNTSEEKVDKMVFKIFKMFHDKLTSNSSPIDKDTSDITCVYVYDKLTTENVRIFKKLAESNKTSIYLKEIIVTDEPVVESEGKKDEEKDNDDSGSESDGSSKSTKSDKKVIDSIPPNTESPMTEKSEKDVINSESSGSESSGSESDSDSDSDSESDTKEESTTGKLIESIETTVASLLIDLEELKKKIQ